MDLGSFSAPPVFFSFAAWGMESFGLNSCCKSQDNMAQGLGICLRLLENNRSSDSVRK